MKKTTLCIIIILILITSCTKSITSKGEAEQKAKEYIMPQMEEMTDILSRGTMENRRR